MCLAQGPQHSDAGEPLGLEARTLPLSHCAPQDLLTQLLNSYQIFTHVSKAIVLSVLAELFWTSTPQIYSKVLAKVITMTECSKCSKILNTSCLPKKPRQAAHMTDYIQAFRFMVG